MSIENKFKVNAEFFLTEKKLLEEYAEKSLEKKRYYSMKKFVQEFYQVEYEVWKLERQRNRRNFLDNPEKFLDKKISLSDKMNIKLRTTVSFKDYLKERGLDNDFKRWQKEVLVRDAMEKIEKIDELIDNASSYEVKELLKKKRFNIERRIKRYAKY